MFPRVRLYCVYSSHFDHLLCCCCRLWAAAADAVEAIYTQLYIDAFPACTAIPGRPARRRQGRSGGDTRRGRRHATLRGRPRLACRPRRALWAPRDRWTCRYAQRAPLLQASERAALIELARPRAARKCERNGALSPVVVLGAAPCQATGRNKSRRHGRTSCRDGSKPGWRPRKAPPRRARKAVGSDSDLVRPVAD